MASDTASFPERRAASKVVLLVEDTDSLDPLEIALGGLNGIGIVVVRNGRAALDLIRSKTLNLVAMVTDLNLPFVDGFELIQAMRAENRYACVPIVVISGDSKPDTPVLALASGANAFFSKPYSPLAIRNSLEEMLHEG